MHDNQNEIDEIEKQSQYDGYIMHQCMQLDI